MRSGQRLLALINDLIEYATGDEQADALNIKPTYAWSFFNSVADEARQLARLNNNQFIYQVNGALPNLVSIDEKRLHQILLNLLGNAAKFCQNGQISFILNAHKEPGNSRYHLQICVEDNGQGIARHEPGSIFEPFQRAGNLRSTEGLGLGLAIAKHWSNRMGGQLTAHSILAKGTRIQLELQVESGSEQALADTLDFIEGEPDAMLNGQKHCIWLIEDAEFIRQYLQEHLESYNYQVAAFASGAEAMKAVQDESKEPPVMVLTDYDLPDLDGYQIASQIRRRWPDMPVVLVTAGYTAAQQHDEAFTDVLLKPVELSALRNVLMQWGQALGEDKPRPDNNRTEPFMDKTATEPHTLRQILAAE